MRKDATDDFFVQEKGLTRTSPGIEFWVWILRVWGLEFKMSEVLGLTEWQVAKLNQYLKSWVLGPAQFFRVSGLGSQLKSRVSDSTSRVCCVGQWYFIEHDYVVLEMICINTWNYYGHWPLNCYLTFQSSCRNTNALREIC